MQRENSQLTDLEALRLGILQLKATEHLHEGNFVYSYFAEETRKYYLVELDDVAQFGHYLKSDMIGSYSRWCADTDPVHVSDEPINLAELES